MQIKTRSFRKWKISYVNAAELDEMLNELYVKKYYQFYSTRSNPVIFDVGALIGETVLYFKDQYPQAKIVAFEPSPRSFKLLKRNVLQNHLRDVRVVNAAAGSRIGKAKFFIDKNPNSPWGRGDSLKENKFSNLLFSQTVQVPTVKLSGYIHQKIDLLKLDIEGAETEVITEIEPKLKYVNQLLFEFHHSRFNVQNNLQTILSVLTRHGYRMRFFLGKWPIPAFSVYLIQTMLKLAGVSEYWMRVYASRRSELN